MLPPKPGNRRVSPNERCIAHLEAGGLLLTPDLRQARILRRLHDRAQADAGARSGPPPRCCRSTPGSRCNGSRRPPIGRTCRRSCRRSHCAGCGGGMSRAMLRGSWIRPISAPARARAGCGSAPMAATSRHVARWPLTRDQQAFLGWARSVEAELRERVACDAGDLARLLVESRGAAGGGSADPARGFPPADARRRSAVCGAVGRRATRSSGSQSPPERGACFHHAAPDPESERDAMLAWLRERVALAPGGIHAVIVPDLDANRGALERALAAALQPELELPGSERDERVFDLAGGHPLAVQPVVDAALAAIACAAGAVDWTAASRCSSELARGGRRTASAARALPPTCRCASARSVAGSADRDSPIAPRAPAPRDSRRRSSPPSPRSMARGGAAPAPGPRRSAHASPPGDGPARRTLGSREYQAARRFRELLRRTRVAVRESRPTSTSPRRSRNSAGSAAAPFQPESGEPAVFVLDAYEDPGVQFDSLWVAGLTATAWPRPVAVDPLLPIEIQRQLGMPGVTPEAASPKRRRVIGRWRAQPTRSCCPGHNSRTTRKWTARRSCPPTATDARGDALAAADARTPGLRRCAELEAVPEAPLPPLATRPGERRRAAARIAGAMCVPRVRGAAPRRVAARGTRRRASTGACGASCCTVPCRTCGRALGSQSALAALDAPARRRWLATRRRRSDRRRSARRAPGLATIDARARMAMRGPSPAAGARSRAPAIHGRRNRARARHSRSPAWNCDFASIAWTASATSSSSSITRPGKCPELGLAGRAHGCAATAAVCGPASGASDGHRVCRRRRGARGSTSASAGTAR